jgi:mono/diheme cytochrome c family protein
VRRATALFVLLPAALAVLTACELFQPRSEGEKLWRKLCAECHGVDGSGNTPRYMGEPFADLRDGAWRGDGDRASLETVIRDGIFGKMPGHDELSTAQMRALLDYLYQLRGERG